MLISTSSVDVAIVILVGGGVVRTVRRSAALVSMLSAMTFMSTVSLLAAAMTRVATVVLWPVWWAELRLTTRQEKIAASL